MATKIEKSTYPTGHKPSDFSCFGPPAVKDGEFQNTMICDLGSFSQEGKDTSKYYHAAVVQSKINSKWYSYFEWGRTGASNPQFQFQECSSKEEAQRDYVKQAESKNIKRGEWVVHQTLGKILQAKPGKDCYLVRPQSTRSTGLPDARTIKLNEQTIYNKEFNIEFKGYSTLEVDTFLDLVIQDYQYFNFEIQKAKEIIQQLQQQNALLQSKLIEAQGKLDAFNSSDANINQVDLLKRLAKLEQEVYNK